jgi:NAD(P)-dependent dehydrogenase (short-subunit alcohol dehydrogenase family)
MGARPPASDHGGNALVRLKDKVCVVAGAVGALGEAVVERFAEEGGLVVAIDKAPHSLGQLSLTADLSVEEQARSAYVAAWDQFGRLDVIYNNAGLIDREDRSALDLSVEVWDRVMAANLTTTWLSCKHGIARILQSDTPRGSVINTASFLSSMGSASAQMAFNVAKAGVEQLSRDLGVHLARKGVRVNALTLGPIETPQLKRMFAELSAEEVERRFTHMPMGRFGSIDEFAATAAYLASDDAGFVTASSFPLNGGIVGAYTVPTT